MADAATESEAAILFCPFDEPEQEAIKELTARKLTKAQVLFFIYNSVN